MKSPTQAVFDHTAATYDADRAMLIPRFTHLRNASHKQRLGLICCVYASLLPCSAATSQDVVTTLPSHIGRTAGVDAPTGIAYTRLFLTATVPPGDAAPLPDAPLDLNLPTLTVQCTQTPAGKFHFELFLNFGAVTDAAFHPPWRTTASEHFPARTEKVSVKMEFLGYTRVKPVTRDFEVVPQPAAQLRYNSPGTQSANMEEISFYFQYLRALPTFRVSTATKTATFATAPLLARIHEEPLCQASHI